MRALSAGMVKTALGFVLAGICGLPISPAEAQRVRLTKLSDVAFGAVSTTTSDISRAQTVCAYVQSLSGHYNVRATGSGIGGAFTLAGSGAPMPYEVQWNGSANQSSGSALVPGQALTGLTAVTVDETCSLLITSSASLIVLLRATDLGQATAGSYTGTLTLVIAAE